MSSFPSSSSRSHASSTIDSSISQDDTGGREANERRLFASLGRLHRSKGKEDATELDEKDKEETKGRRSLAPDEKKEPIKFKDAVGRKFTFPFHLCATWEGMNDLIQQAFQHVDVIGPHVREGHYDLVGPNGEIILPQVWEALIEPDWSITMHMWPMPEEPPKQPGPPPGRPPPHGHPGMGPQSGHLDRHGRTVPEPPPPTHRGGPPPPTNWPGGPQPPRPADPRMPVLFGKTFRAFAGGTPALPPELIPTKSPGKPPPPIPSLSGHKSVALATSNEPPEEPENVPSLAPDNLVVSPYAQSFWYPDRPQSRQVRTEAQYLQTFPSSNNVTQLASKITLLPEPTTGQAHSRNDSNINLLSSGIPLEGNLEKVVLGQIYTEKNLASGLASRYLETSESERIEGLKHSFPSQMEATADKANSTPQIERLADPILDEDRVREEVNDTPVQGDYARSSSTSTPKQDDSTSLSEDLLLIDFGSAPCQTFNSTQEFDSSNYESCPIRHDTSVLDLPISEQKIDHEQPIDSGTDVLDSVNSGRIALLYAQIEELKQANAALQSCPEPPLPSRWVNMHRVKCKGQDATSVYMDVPVVTKDNSIRHLEGRVRISDVDDYLEQREDVAFIVFLDYVCDGHTGNDRKSGGRSAATSRNKPINETSSQEAPSWMQTDLVNPIGESTSIICDVLQEGLETLTSSDETLKQYLPFSEDFKEISAPYLFYFYFRDKVDEQVLKLEEKQCQQVQLFTSYISTHFDAEYEKAEVMFSQGLVSPPYLEFLFVPDEVVVCNDGKDLIGHQQKSTPRNLVNPMEVVGISFDAETWEFDGNFRTRRTTIDVIYGKASTPVNSIDKLKAYPLRYAPSKVEEKIRKRGETFWACRNHQYITYSGMNYTNDNKFVRTRFMIDVATYWKIHSDKRLPPFVDQLGGAMAQDEPPEGNFIFLLPPNIFGFNMQEKKWVDLRMECVSPIEWNKKAFETLAVDQETKELITAVVSNKIEAEKGTDLMAGKGNGLIVLLHGGPGTGKTLTAESVAETAEKPLYRVTCGDLGIDPIKIEEYLDSVFHLGKIWDCVVLLDEADVFLEQRTLNDLSRNALVSVFLRALEYYDGILVLTSNRVGTFDEAFKSRIQLALHYEALNQSQRHQIWENFTQHLDGMNDDIDAVDITAHITELAQYEMNGRQIRNAVTTARQLALFKGKKMDYGHLKHVIKVSAKFDKYLFQLNAEVSDADWARDERIR